jgi:hypothetical protein
MSYKILLVGWLHPKNKIALLKYKNITISYSIESNIDLTQYDIVYSPTTLIVVNQYPNVKFMFGPHFSVFPEEHHMNMIKGPNSIYIQPSQWTVDLWKNYHCCNDIVIKPLPFGVDTELFSPDDNSVKENVFVYFKSRDPNILKMIHNFLGSSGISYKLFVYGNYSETEYLSYLKTCKYGIWLDAYESQGFALQEALSMNVPLFVWSIYFLSQEYGSSYLNFCATTIPYWDSMCGEVIYSENEFNEGFSKFLSNLSFYKPREFVLKKLSINVCEQKFIELIQTL